MKKANPFFAIGTAGLILTATLHIAFSQLIELAATPSIFLFLYPAFVVFLAIGMGQIIKKKKAGKY